MIEHQSVAVTFANGLRILRITISAPVASFSPDVAAMRGFVLSEDQERWEGGITDAGIEDEIARAWPGQTPISWRRIDDADLPPVQFKGAWFDNGKDVAIDMDKARLIVAAKLAEEAAEKQRLAAIASNPDVLKADTVEQLAALFGASA